MTEKDGVIIADKPTWALGYRELLAILLKRIIALPSKLIGFKPFCLILASWLLVNGHIDGWIWLVVLVSVLFGIVGLKVMVGNRPGNGG
jgi:hypothetical protein